MNKRNRDFRDIYPADAETPSAAQPSGNGPSFYRPGWGFRFLLKLSLWLVFLGLSTAAIRQSVFPPQSPSPEPQPRVSFVPAHDLPFKEQWVIDYRRAAPSVGSDQQNRPLRSTQWVKNAAYHIIMGEQALTLNRPETAQVHFEEALAIFPDLQDARRALGLALLKQKKFDQAADVLELAARETVSFEVLVNLGTACIGAGRFERAETVLQRALAMQPDSAGCRKNLAMLYQQTGNIDQAEHHLRIYLRRRPEDLEMIRFYTAMLNKANRADDAVRFLEHLPPLQKDPSAVPLLLARNAAVLGDAERAVAALKSVAKHLPPARTLVEMNDEVFETIRRLDAFEDLVEKLQIQRTLQPTLRPR